MMILHVVAPGPSVGGIERVVGTLASAQYRAGHAVHVACIVDKGADPPVPEGIPEDSVHRVSVPPRAYGKERAWMARLCATLTPDVVHTHGYRPDVVDTGVARRFAPTVTTAHGATGGGWRNVCYEWLQRRAFRHCHAVAAVSEPLRTRLIRAGVPAHRIRLIPNACEPVPMLSRRAAREALRCAADGPLLGWIGRLSPEKGCDVFVDALPGLADRPVQAVVIGDGAERGALEARAAAAGLGAGRVMWRGPVPDARRYLQALDVLVLSSRTEGSPMVLLEAMVAGVPIVATRVGGVEELVSEAEALLVPPDDPPALARALRTTLDRPAEAAARAQRAYRRVRERFGVAAWVRAYESLYRTVARHPRGLVGG